MCKSICGFFSCLNCIQLFKFSILPQSTFNGGRHYLIVQFYTHGIEKLLQLHVDILIFYLGLQGETSEQAQKINIGMFHISSFYVHCQQ